MTKLQNETFIRSQIRRILFEEPKPEENTEEPKPKRKKKSGGKKVHGGIGRGDISGMMRDVFGGGKKQDRLAETNPAKLMKNLNISGVTGKDDQSKTEDLLNTAVAGTEAMGEAFSKPDLKTDSAGRWGYFIANKALEKDRYALLFVFDTVRGAVNARTLNLDASVKVEAASGGALVYGVDSDDDKWNHNKAK